MKVEHWWGVDGLRVWHVRFLEFGLDALERGSVDSD